MLREVGRSQVHSYGRVQIPAILRNWLALRDGDTVVWWEKTEKDGSPTYYVKKLVAEVPESEA